MLNFIKKRVIYFFLAIPTLLGLLSAMGWFFDYTQLKSFGQNYLPMKMPTAISLIICVFSSYILIHKNKKCNYFALSFLSFLNIQVMSLYLLHRLEFLNLAPFFELFSDERITNIDKYPAYPSIAACLCFILLFTSYLLKFVVGKMSFNTFNIINFSVLGVGLMGVLGYIFDLNCLYFYLSKETSGLALPTCISFFFLALTNILSSTKQHEKFLIN